MGIFERLKKIKKSKPTAAPAKKPITEVKEKTKAKGPSKTETTFVLDKRNFDETALVLLQPHISEKATELTKFNQYIFRVDPRANKIQIKRAVEALYNVEVAKVSIINIKRKRRVLGRISGFRPGYKKAVVTLKPGQSIELLPR